MALILQSSGFWLMICAVLLVLVACTALRGHTPIAGTTTPHNVTLTSTPFPTFLAIDTRITTDIPPLSLTSDQIYERSTLPPPDTGIVIDTPQCYALSGGQYSCLGQIWNYSNEILGDTRLQLNFFDDNGGKIGEQIITSEQRITAIGSFSPYRAIVSAKFTDGITSKIDIRPTLADYLPHQPNIQRLSIVEARGNISNNGRYHLTVTILNDSGHLTQDIRIFTTLDGKEWGIVGYSIHEVEDQLNNGEQRLIQLELIPHALPDEIQHFIHVEARISD